MRTSMIAAVIIFLFAGLNTLQAQWVESSGISGHTVTCFLASGGVLYAGTIGSGIFYSNDNGLTWASLSSQPANANIRALAVSGGALFAGTPTGLYKMSGTSWAAVNIGFRDTTVSTLLPQGNGLLAGTLGAGVYVSTDEGTTWTQRNSGLGNLYVTSLVVTSDPHNFSGIEIYAATYDGLYYATAIPGGWNLLTAGITNMSSFVAIGQNLFGGSFYSGISLSTNDGTTWSTMNSGLPDLYVQCLASSEGSLFAGTEAGVGILMNNADANEWIPENSGLGNTYVIALLVSDGALLAGTESGVWSYPLSIFPKLTSVKDVPFDQGGYVNLTWTASILDTNLLYLPKYSIWRSIPPSISQNLPAEIYGGKDGVSSTEKRIRMVATTEGTFAFQWIADQQAHRLSTYSFAAPTLYDSMAANGMQYFMVSSETNNANIFYDSNIDSGYSVDNIPPAAPAGIAAGSISGKVTLQWRPNSEKDLKEYEIFRSDTTIGDTKSVSPYASTIDTSFTDSSSLTGKTAYYLVCAEDIHGNLSAPSKQVSVTVTGIVGESDTPITFTLGQNYPNPFNPTTVISYQLAMNSHVTLKVYDVLGREMATLVNERENAGSYSVRFDGSRLASGVYFYKLSAGNFASVKKLVVLK